MKGTARLIVLAALTCGVLARPAGTQGTQAGPGAGGSLRGRVDIRRLVHTPAPAPAVAGLLSRGAAARASLQPAVVFLESQEVPATSPLRAAPRTAARARMDQRDETFVPRVLAVDAGTMVDFPNNDGTFHNVFSLSKTKRFDLGRYGRGKSRPVRFDRPGIVRVFCDIHSHMSAFVLVFNHPFHAATDDEGRYRIDSIPVGTYTVTVWHEGAVRETRTVTIPGAGASVDLDLLVQ